MSQIATKNTGNYVVKLRRERDEYVVDVNYTGEWGGGSASIELVVSAHKQPTIKKLQAWFKSEIRGDHDAELLLSEAGYDTYGNLLRTRPSAVEIQV